MKKEIEVCDICEKEAGIYECGLCKKKLCYKCVIEINMRPYTILRVKCGDDSTKNDEGIAKINEKFLVCKNCFGKIKNKLNKNNPKYLNLIHEKINEESFNEIRKLLMSVK